MGLLYSSFRRTPNRGRTKTPEMIRGLSRWRGNQTFSVTCWKASMWLRKTCVSQSLIGGEGLCVYSKACEWPFWKICSTIMCIFQTKDLHRFTSQPLTVWTAIFPTCHHGSFHPPFTKPFRYPKVNYHGHILSSLQKPGFEAPGRVEVIFTISFFLRVEMLIPWNEWGFHSGAWHCNGVFSQLHGHRLGA